MEFENESGDCPAEPRVLASRACDSCRARKIKCDRASPCSNCRIAKSTCRTSPRVKEQRQRVLISHQYEKRIETIDQRLSEIERLLQTLALSIPASNRQRNLHTASSVPHHESPRTCSAFEEPPNEVVSSAHFEGESALSTHSVLASAIFEKTMGSSPNMGQNPAMIQALSSLRDIVKRQSRPSGIHTMSFSDKKPSRKLDLSQLELPPLDVVLSMLRLSKNHYPIFFLTFPFIELPCFVQLCKDLYFCIDDYSSAQFATVNCVLSYLFKEFVHYGGKDALKERFTQYSELCISNFEAVITSFDLFMEPSYENIVALALGAYHATERSKISLCWNFVATAARMCQCLGYHRTIGRKDDGEEYTSAEIASRKYIFWFIYLMDKTMSLCLGRTSTLQDYDIAIDYPELTTDPELRPWRVVLHVWFDYSKIMGRVYEHLFSARALTDTAAVRSQKAHEIGEEIKIWRDGCLHFEFTGGHHSFFFEWMGHSIDLSYYLMLTLIYRVLPPTQPPETPSGLSLLCVESARRALQLHQHIITVFQANDTFMLKGYVDWSLLQFPFVPFLVLFCHTISSGDLEDLKLLEEVATTLRAAGGVSEGAERLYRLCMVFSQVANVYVDAKLQEARCLSDTSDYQPAAYLGEHFDSYLNALGLGPSSVPSVPTAVTGVGNPGDGEVLSGLLDIDMAQSLEDWYLGSRQMMGLLESDF